MAVVGDTTWEKVLTQLSKLIYARDSKFFHSAISVRLGLGFESDRLKIHLSIIDEPTILFSGDSS